MQLLTLRYHMFAVSNAVARLQIFAKWRAARAALKFALTARSTHSEEVPVVKSHTGLLGTPSQSELIGEHTVGRTFVQALKPIVHVILAAKLPKASLLPLFMDYRPAK